MPSYTLSTQPLSLKQFRQSVFYLLAVLTTTTTLLVASTVGARSAPLADDEAGEKPEMQAVRAMRARGIDNPEQLLQFAAPQAILATCRRLDEMLSCGARLTRPSAWLASRIRSGGVEETDALASPKARLERKLAEFRAQFVERARVFPPGSVCERHATLEERRQRSASRGRGDDLFPEDTPEEWPVPDEEGLCAGELVVIDRGGLILTACCDLCRELWSYPLRALAVLPRAPLALGRELPVAAVPARRPPAGGWFSEADGLRKLDPMAGVGVSLAPQEAR